MLLRVMVMFALCVLAMRELFSSFGMGNGESPFEKGMSIIASGADELVCQASC